MKRLKEIIYKYRFEFFLATLVFNLFGILLFTDALFITYLFPIGLLLNILAGINLISIKKVKILLTILFLATAFTSGFAMSDIQHISLDLLRFGFYFLFYVVITYEIIKQIWFTKDVNKDLIIGVISGYITLGLVGFFIFMAVEMAQPGSFHSSLFTDTFTMTQKSDSILYYSYITLMTIGYGEIVPVTTVAQKAAILLGLCGQFYLVIITAVVVGKYLNYAQK
ncbi:ion channel [Dokdonia sp.]|uniref:ion channel n=1 Tax=Dokdonia sp. TaxID=2024995 RepID=UPI00326457E9